MIGQNYWRSGTDFTFDQFDWVRKQGAPIEHDEMDRASLPYHYEYRPFKTDQSTRNYGRVAKLGAPDELEINPHKRFQMDAQPYQYESRTPETNQCFVNGASKKFSIDLRPILRSMSQSCLEVEVPTEAIEEMVTSPTCNEAFQHLKGGTED